MESESKWELEQQLEDLEKQKKKFDVDRDPTIQLVEAFERNVGILMVLKKLDALSNG